MLRTGSSGSEVRAWQQWLADNGYDPGPIDGIFGPKTTAATKSFQSASGITSDGVVGPNTLAAQNTVTVAPGVETPAEPAAPVADNTTQTATTGGANVAGAGTGISSASGAATAPAENQAQVGVGGAGQDPKTSLTIVTGQEMLWSFDEGSGKWYVSYKLPNSGLRALFEADPDQMDALFGLGKRPVAYQGINNLRDFLQLQGNVFSGNIALMEGTGSFEDEVRKTTALALDEGILPDWAKQDDAAMDILYLAQAEGRNFDWVVTKLAELPSFKARFPNLDRLKSQGSLTTIEAVTGFLEFEGGAKTALAAAGFSESVVTPAAVSAMLEKGYSLETFNVVTSNFKRMQDNAGTFSAFNEILAAQGLPTLSTQQEYYDFVAGKAPSDLYDVYEASSIQEAAVNAGLGDIFSSQDAIRTALATDQTRDSANLGMRQAATLLLRLRNEVDVGKFNLNHEDLIDMSLGMPSRSGATEAEIQENISRAVETARGGLKKKATPFTGFTQQGTPQAASLSSLRQSG